MRVALLTGIFPPDIGGPATHSADLAAELADRGHQVTVVTLWDGPGAVSEPRLVRYPRSRPWPRRKADVVGWLFRHRAEYDVVYATGLVPDAVVGARLAGRPVVVKIVGDPAWERGRRQGLTASGFDEFQDATPRRWSRLGAMAALRDWSVRAASAVVVPSENLRAAVRGWSGGRDAIVVPNGVRHDPGAPRDAQESHPDGVRVVSVGRLVAHKRVDVLVEAVAKTPGVRLDVLGDGPELEPLRELVHRLGVEDRVRFPGRLSHDAVLAALGSADAFVSASAYEGLSHVAIEALVCGIPVIAPVSGGAAEVVRDGENGIVVDPPTPARFADTLARIRDDAALRARLSEGAKASGGEWRFDRCADRVLSVLESVLTERPLAVFLGKTSVPDPVPDDLRRKFALHRRHLRQVSVHTGPPGVREVEGARLVTLPAIRPRLLGGLVFYTAGPAVAVAVAAGRAPSAVMCQSPYEALATTVLVRLIPRRLRPRVQVDVHGDWRASYRLYGAGAKRLLTRPADAAAAWALRRADLVRVISTATEELAREAGYRGQIERYITYTDLDGFLGPPAVMPAERRATFIGALNQYKAVDVLLDAWPDVSAAVPSAELVVAGSGPSRSSLERQARSADPDGGIRFLGAVPRDEVAAILDRSTCLVLPSRSEGLGRVVVEALARGRPVVTSDAGGIPELVDDGETGLVVPAGDAKALARALIDVLGDEERAAAMGTAARRRFDARNPAAAYEGGIERLAAWIAAGRD